MATDTAVADFFIKIDGMEIPKDLSRQLVRVVVDSDLHQPDMFTLLFHDRDMEWVDDPRLGVGKEVEIWGQSATQSRRSSTRSLLFKGEITTIEPDFSRGGRPTLLLRGYDRSHRMHRGQKRRSFLQTTDSDIALKLAAEEGLRAEVDASPHVYEYLFQNNQTNMEFLVERARRIGYQVYVFDRTLYFRKGTANHGELPELNWGKDLLDFHPRLTAVHQADEVLVRSWDPLTKQAVEGRATVSQSQIEVGISHDGGDVAQAAFGSTSQAVVVDVPMESAKKASDLAQALYNEINGEFIQGEGSCFGNPLMLAGKTVKLSGLGKRFSGVYFITAATHIYESHGYATHFKISGQGPDTVSHLLADGQGRNPRTQYAGAVVGIVTNISDPRQLGRVKVKFPWLEENEESNWARMASPMAGNGSGFFVLPEINDEVLIAFEHGDILRPFVIGMLWNGRDKPPLTTTQAVGGGKVNQRVWQSRTGHQILLDDTRSGEKVIVRSKNGHVIELDDSAGAQRITIKDSAGNLIELDATQNSITIDAQGNLTLKNRGNLTLQSMGNLKLQSAGSVDIQATGQLSLNGMAGTSVKSTATVQIQAPLIRIN